MTIEYEFIDGCNNSPVVPYYLKAMHELHQDGLNHNCVSFNYEQKAFIAKLNDEVIGLILIDDAKWKNSLIVVLGYIDSTHRRKGIYSELWRRVVKYAQELERRIIEGSTSLSNPIMQSVMLSQGRIATSINYDFHVPKLLEDID